MDNDPSQTSKRGLEAISSIEPEFHRIPARSTGSNPIENVFHLVKKAVDDESTRLKITKESLKKFEERVLRHFQNILLLVSIRSSRAYHKESKRFFEAKEREQNFDGKGKLNR